MFTARACITSLTAFSFLFPNASYAIVDPPANGFEIQTVEQIQEESIPSFPKRNFVRKDVETATQLIVLQEIQKDELSIEEISYKYSINLQNIIEAKELFLAEQHLQYVSTINQITNKNHVSNISFSKNELEQELQTLRQEIRRVSRIFHLNFSSILGKILTFEINTPVFTNSFEKNLQDIASRIDDLAECCGVENFTIIALISVMDKNTGL